NGDLTFQGGQQQPQPQTIQIPILDDHKVEPDETFLVTLKGPSVLQTSPSQTVALGSPSQAEVTIHDLDTAAPHLIFDNQTVQESAGTAQVHATLSRPYSLPFTVTYQTQDGSATTAANDYVAI